jgi:hypothetical protein
MNHLLLVKLFSLQSGGGDVLPFSENFGSHPTMPAGLFDPIPYVHNLSGNATLSELYPTALQGTVL